MRVGVDGVAGPTIREYRRGEELQSLSLAEPQWKVRAKVGDSPVSERDKPLSRDPKYHGARGIPWESGRTISQG